MNSDLLYTEGERESTGAMVNTGCYCSGILSVYYIYCFSELLDMYYIVGNLKKNVYWVVNSWKQHFTFYVHGRIVNNSLEIHNVEIYWQVFLRKWFTKVQKYTYTHTHTNPIRSPIPLLFRGALRFRIIWMFLRSHKEGEDVTC